jgi:hypothetical protein
MQVEVAEEFDQEVLQTVEQEEVVVEELTLVIQE